MKMKVMMTMSHKIKEAKFLKTTKYLGTFILIGRKGFMDMLSFKLGL